MKIACLGAAPSSARLAPFQDLGWEIWACSPPNYDLPRVDAWFEVHSLRRKSQIPANKPFIDVLIKHPRVYVNGKDPMKQMLLPNSVAYPIEEMTAKYGRWFFSSSLAYMLALAIEQKPTHIGMWGVDMSATEEYGYQRAGCHFFIREAEKAGIVVMAPPESDILNAHPLYGFKEASPMWWKQRTRKLELQQRIDSATRKIEGANQEILVLKGALDDMNYVDNTYDPSLLVAPELTNEELIELAKKRGLLTEVKPNE